MPHDNNSLAVFQAKAELHRKTIISGYIEKYATIAGRVLTPALYGIYVEALAGVELRKLEKGLKRYLEEGTRWPWPGELREYCEEEI